MQILNPPAWKKPSGYSNGVAVKGRLIFVSGQIGWDHDQKLAGTDLCSQVRQALLNIVAVLKEGEAKAEDVTRLTWFVKDKQEYLKERKEIGEVYRRVFGDHYPAMSLFEVKDLLEEGAKVEIEATAVVGE